MSTGTFNNVNELTALSGGGVVGFTGTTTEEAAVTVGGQAAQTSQVGTRFEKAVTLPAGTNTVTVAAVDPSGNTNSANYRVVVSGGAGQSFTYDANGNMTSDDVRTYAWDAENRLIKIVEGAKRTEIEYDGFHHWTRILERNGATTVSDRRFIWDGNTLVEQRNGTSTTAAQRYLPMARRTKLSGMLTRTSSAQSNWIVSAALAEQPRSRRPCLIPAATADTLLNVRQ